MGRPSRYSYHPRLAPEQSVKFNGIIKYDWETGNQDQFSFPENGVGEEVVFIPKSTRRSEDDGWLGTLLHSSHANGEETNEFVIFDATHVQGGPIAKINIPCRIPAGFHCKWVPQT